MGLDLEYDDVVAKEKVLARTTARLSNFKGRHIPYNRRRRGFWGELVVTENHLCFRLRLKTLKYNLILVAISMFLIVFVHSFHSVVSHEEGLFTYLQRIDTIILISVLLIIFLIITVSFNKIKKYFEKGFVWDLNKAEIAISGNELMVNQGMDMTGFSLDYDSYDVISALESKSAMFQISNLSKLDYHQKLAVLEERFKAGKISKELYEEMKKRMPYIETDDSPHPSYPS